MENPSEMDGLQNHNQLECVVNLKESSVYKSWIYLDDY